MSLKKISMNISYSLCLLILFLTFFSPTLSYATEIDNQDATTNTGEEQTEETGKDTDEDDTDKDGEEEETPPDEGPTLEELLKQNFGVKNNAYYKKAVTIQFEEFTAQLNDTEITSGTVVNKNGNYTLNFYYEGELCHTIEFVFDNVAPVIKGVSKNGLYANKTLKITFDEGTAKIDGKTYKSGSGYSTVGVHEIVVTDKAGNKTTRKFTIYNASLVTNPYSAYSFSRLNSEIKKLTKNYPGLITTYSAGKTVAGKNIPVVTLGTGKKKILIVGSVHAREHVTTALIMRSIDTYAKAYAKNTKIDNTDVRKVLSSVTFYFVPMLNVDGVAVVTKKATSSEINIAKKAVGSSTYNSYKNVWKANLRGVDLNRNFPFVWNKRTNSPKKATYMGYKGKSAGSEPETKAMVKLCNSHKFAFLYTMHTKGQVVYWRDAYNGNVPGASTLIQKVRSITGYTLMKTTANANGYGGGFENWFRYAFNKPAFCIELTPSYVDYQKANKMFDSTIWKKCKSLFLRTAL